MAEGDPIHTIAGTPIEVVCQQCKSLAGVRSSLEKITHKSVISNPAHKGSHQKLTAMQNNTSDDGEPTYERRDLLLQIGARWRHENQVIKFKEKLKFSGERHSQRMCL